MSSDGEAPLFVTVERRQERNDGGALLAMVAHRGAPSRPTVPWDNPFAPAVKGHGVQWHGDEIGVAACLMSLVDAVHGGAPTYSGAQARLDQEIILAVCRSADDGGPPIRLPLER